MLKYLFLIVGMTLLASCNRPAANKKESIYHTSIPLVITDQVQCIPVHTDGDYFNHVEDYLRTVSYVKLASEPLLTRINDIHIINEKIYVWDQADQIVCYDMQGNMIFRIHGVGNGPGEYSGIHAFALNPDRAEVVIYDNMRISLHYYSMLNGKYLRTESFPKPNPSEMVFFDGVYFYNNRDHRNYPNDNSLHYSLLVSADGLKMDKNYFPHNDAEEKYIFSPSLQTFYDNDTTLYYCKNFDNTVYQLGKDSIKARYRIDLPNPLPFSKIEERANEWKLIKSDYAFGISNVYECESLLYFRFFKSGYIMAALYDLAKNEQICCVKAMQDSPRLTIPLINTIDGVYKGQFFSILSPEFIDYCITKCPGEYPAIFQQYDAQSENPIIAFYEVVK